jgi:hypothetical protein
MSSVNGKVALITGGANGIGAEVARRLYAKGAKLVLTDLDEVQLKETAARIGEDRVLTQVADVRQFADMQSAVDKGTECFGGIDTPLVREGKADLASFNEMINRLPGPLKKTTSVEECGRIFIKGIEQRKRQINCPNWVGLLRWLKPLMSTRLGDSTTLQSVPELLPQMDAEVGALGRSMSARTESIEKH